jgi:hypothetical protein
VPVRPVALQSMGVTSVISRHFRQIWVRKGRRENSRERWASGVNGEEVYEDFGADFVWKLQRSVKESSGRWSTRDATMERSTSIGATHFHYKQPRYGVSYVCSVCLRETTFPP